MAAGSLLIREAGGHISAADGADFEVEGGSIATGNATVHRALLELLAAAAPEAPPAAAD
jgi:myo-inositol-1(or 4)-monophosphatase